MSINIQKVGYQPTFQGAKPKLEPAKQVIQKQNSSLNEKIGLLGWGFLILALVGSIIHGGVNAFNNKNKTPEVTDNQPLTTPNITDESQQTLDIKI